MTWSNNGEIEPSRTEVIPLPAVPVRAAHLEANLQMGGVIVARVRLRIVEIKDGRVVVEWNGKYAEVKAGQELVIDQRFEVAS